MSAGRFVVVFSCSVDSVSHGHIFYAEFWVCKFGVWLLYSVIRRTMLESRKGNLQLVRYAQALRENLQSSQD